MAGTHNAQFTFDALTRASDVWLIYARMTKEAALQVSSVVGSTPFHDFERGFQSEELELQPEELAPLANINVSYDSSGDDASDEELDSRGRPSVKCFAGTVVDSCEGHVRIHFAGTPKKDDIWVKLDSLDLFIDAGPRDEDSDDDDAEAKAAKASPSKKGKAKSKGKKAAGKKRRAS